MNGIQPYGKKGSIWKGAYGEVMGDSREQVVGSEGRCPSPTTTTQPGGLPLPRSVPLTLKHSFLNNFDRNLGQTYKTRLFLVENKSAYEEAKTFRSLSECLYSVTL